MGAVNQIGANPSGDGFWKRRWYFRLWKMQLEWYRKDTMSQMDLVKACLLFTIPEFDTVCFAQLLNSSAGKVADGGYMDP